MCTCDQVMEFEESMIFDEEESGMELLKRDDFDDLKGFTIALFSPYEETCFGCCNWDEIITM